MVITYSAMTPPRIRVVPVRADGGDPWAGSAVGPVRLVRVALVMSVSSGRGRWFCLAGTLGPGAVRSLSHRCRRRAPEALSPPRVGADTRRPPRGWRDRGVPDADPTARPGRGPGGRAICHPAGDR